MPVKLFIDPFINPDWVIQDWQIKFMLSDKLLTLARKQSTLRNWYEDPPVVATYTGITSQICRGQACR